MAASGSRAHPEEPPTSPPAGSDPSHRIDVESTVQAAALRPTFADVTAAAERIADLVERTPSARSRTLSVITGAEVVLKFENLQFTGSFKDRGAANRLLQLSDDQRRRGVIAASAGNHAQGVAYHAARLGIPAVIVVPTTAPLAKVANTARLGATIVQHGATVAEAAELMAERAAAEGLCIIHPYDDPEVIAGQGTVALELFADHPDLDVVVVPVGGGGLAAGMTLVACEVAPACELVGVQSASYPAMAAALAGREVDAPGGTSIADGIAVKRPGRIATEVLRDAGVDVVTVPEARIEEAVGLLLEVEKTVAEGAGAAGLAAVLADPERFAGRKVGLVLSGGNIDLRLLSSVILRALVRQRRMSRLRVETDDLPGNLGRVATEIGRLGGNLIEVAHQRLLTEIPARRVDLDLLLETLDEAHLDRILAGLVAAGYRVDLLEP